uniref:ATP synthase complex subunit 8 n=1 Tax=Phrynocephalus theobaldi orientalis TaxID=1318721 RepID=A0A059V6M6_9SAUR|nr:ATPase subunit 8 [Phrynocephalus theobaldi orientalis]
MPQLATSNWFSTFLWTWLVLLTLTTKITKIKLPTKPKKFLEKMYHNQWIWPWW